MTDKLPEWPEKGDVQYASQYDWLLHYHRAAYWESRCRLAVEALKYQDRGSTHWDGCERDHWRCALLKAIGPLPPREGT